MTPPAADDAIERYVCPCRGPCQRCGNVADEDDRQHPLDGLAGCPACPLWHTEWWAHVGPFMDGRCPRDAVEMSAWAAWDGAYLKASAS